MNSFRLATAADEATLRRLLQENSMPSWVDMRLEREPSFFDADHFYGDNWAVLAEQDGVPFGMYTAAKVPVYLNGAPGSCGYLGGLRVQARERQRIRHLRQGYASIQSLAPVLPTPPWWFTVIARDNHPARRLLEAGLPGLPSYRTLGDLTTYAVAIARCKPQGLWRQAQTEDVQALLAFHAGQASRLQLAPVLSRDLVERIGLHCFWLHGAPGEIVAMAAWWDQRAFKQVVAQRYHRALQWALPVYNGLARVTQRVPLPQPGQALAQSYLAFAAFDQALLQHAKSLSLLLCDLLTHCPTAVAAIGLCDGHALGAVLQTLRPLRYGATVYAVEWGAPAELDSRPVHPEVALL